MVILNRLKKGQVWSYDLIIGSILFVIAMGILAFFWWSARTNMSEQKDVLILESIRVADSLVSPGSPTDWETHVNLNDQNTWDDVQQIGLVQSWNDNESNILSNCKVYNFRMMSFANYSLTKTKLRSRYDFYIQFIIHNANGSDQMATYSGSDLWIGKPFNEQTVKSIAKTDRLIVYNHSLVFMRVYIWSDSLWD